MPHKVFNYEIVAELFALLLTVMNSFDLVMFIAHPHSFISTSISFVIFTSKILKIDTVQILWIKLECSIEYWLHKSKRQINNDWLKQRCIFSESHINQVILILRGKVNETSWFCDFQGMSGYPNNSSFLYSNFHISIHFFPAYLGITYKQ